MRYLLTRKAGYRWPFASRVRPWMMVTLLAVLYVAIVLGRHGWDPLSLVMRGTRFYRHDPHGTEGYDGQFAYYIALNPAEGWRYADVPAYRYQRILYPLLSRSLALGRPGLIPWTMLLINLVALAGGTWVTEKLLDGYGAPRHYALVYGLYGGQLMALRLDLNEPLSCGLVQAGIYAYEQRRPALGALAFGLAILAKETALVVAGGYLLYLACKRRWKEGVVLAAVALLPFLAYQLFLLCWLGAFGLGSGGAGATPFELIPFMGLFRIWQVSPGAFLLIALIVIPLAVGPALACFFLALRDIVRSRWHPLAFSLLLQSATFFFLPFSTYREPLAMLRISTGLVALALLYGAWRGSRRMLNFSLFWLASLAFLAKGL